MLTPLPRRRPWKAASQAATTTWTSRIARTWPPWPLRQRPRIPVWVVAAWPRPKSMRRALRCDGLLPVRVDGGEFRGITPADVRAMRRWLAGPPGR
jgi:hypothetical protein